jgi:ketosteroid isomerase-like protein
MSNTKEITTTEEQIKTILDERISAIYARDLPGVLNKYAPDIVSFDIGDPLQNNGIEIIRRRLQDWFASYQGPINQEMNNLVVNVGKEVAFSYCLTRTYGTSIKERNLICGIVLQAAFINPATSG